MRWAVEQFERSQWLVVSRWSVRFEAERAKAVRQGKHPHAQFRVVEKPIGESAVA